MLKLVYDKFGSEIVVIPAVCMAPTKINEKRVGREFVSIVFGSEETIWTHSY